MSSTPKPHARHERIYATIASIPAGRVSSYGEVALEAGLGRGARQVAAALRLLPAWRELPWHRVVRAGGQVAPRPGPGFGEQIRLLRAEGVAVADNGRVAWEEHRMRWGCD